MGVCFLRLSGLDASWFCCGSVCYAQVGLRQSLIVGIPSADVAAKGQFAIEPETQFNRFRSGPYWNGFTFATYGVGKYTKLASSV